MTYAVLDTNLFLHFKPVEQVDWRDCLDADEVALVVPRRIVMELDEQKDQNNKQKLRERARTALRRIEDIVLAGDDAAVRDRVTMEYADLLPPDFFAEHHLDRDTPDDHLVATALDLQDEYADAQVVIVTDDTGPRLSAAQHDVETKRPPDDWRLPSARSEEEKELRKLQQENERLKNRVPDLRLAFADGETFSKFTVSEPDVRNDEEIEEEVERVKEEYPEKQGPQKGGEIGAFFEFAIPPEDEYERYNDTLPEFYSDYRQYLNNLRQYKQLAGRTLELELVLVNDGTAPAEDIDVDMHFPDGFLLGDRSDKPTEPEEPNPPRSPQSLGSRFGQIASLSARPQLDPSNIPSPPEPSNVSTPTIRESNSYEVQVHVRKVKHHMQVGLDSLYVIFPSYDEVSSFEFDYWISAANHPDVIDGTLNVVVEKED
jgi:hypothetical protein